MATQACAGAFKIAVMACSGAARMRSKSLFEPASVPPVRSKRLFEPAVRDHYAKVLVLVALCSEPLHPALLGTVHGYARVHTSIYIYIDIIYMVRRGWAVGAADPPSPGLGGRGASLHALGLVGGRVRNFVFVLSHVSSRMYRLEFLILSCLVLIVPHVISLSDGPVCILSSSSSRICCHVFVAASLFLPYLPPRI